ncbi:hypothetical protein NLJ89_g11685 [Agrocybe chaxingu]|uniref:Microbial-type PARG catalytic domain-containing protein n=1 Tax=Agrocybe chaxingu TaxID=84603 RepID=A0A9W8JVV1_9AGAR|nr:hypothetical protein NLJ89_g11685 [Agrocybe chaxingu]
MTKQSKGKQVKPTGVPLPSKGSLVDIAASTLEKIEQGSYDINGYTYNLKHAIDDTNTRTAFYAADSNLYEWRSNLRQERAGAEDAETDGVEEKRPKEKRPAVKVTISECSTLAGARELSELVASETEKEEDAEERVGVLNFASAKNPGGGFIRGASAQSPSPAPQQSTQAS